MVINYRSSVIIEGIDSGLGKMAKQQLIKKDPSGGKKDCTPLYLVVSRMKTESYLYI